MERTVMNHYELVAPFQNKNAGFCRWTYAVKGGKHYFLKEFLDPVYPDEGTISPDLREERIAECRAFEQKKKNLYQAVNNASGGNIVKIHEFFRYDNHYYTAAERVPCVNIPPAKFVNLPYKVKLLFCRTLAFELLRLHRNHVVHADIKESNILIKKSERGVFVGKIIDFDASFFEDAPPADADDIGGDQVYLAPETCMFICGDPVKLTCKIDVFSLGLLFHQYLTGKMPGFDRHEYDYAFDAVLDGQDLEVDPTLPYLVQVMLHGMLMENPEDRFSMERVYSFFKAMDPAPANAQKRWF